MYFLYAWFENTIFWNFSLFNPSLLFSKVICLIKVSEMYYYIINSVKKTTKTKLLEKRCEKKIRYHSTWWISLLNPLWYLSSIKLRKKCNLYACQEKDMFYPRPGYICEESGLLRILCCLCHRWQFGGLLQKGTQPYIYIYII